MARTLQLSSNHMAAFVGQQRRRFEDDVWGFLQRENSTECLRIGEGGIRNLIRAGIERASRYEITLETDVAEFIQLMLAIGEDFDASAEMPWVAKILTQHATGATKINQIYEHLMFQSTPRDR